MGYIQLERKAFFHNADYFAQLLKSKDKLCIALKDNAYGHGVQQMAQLSHEYGIKHTIVRDIQEANIANDYGFESILVLYEKPHHSEYPSTFTFSINSIEQLETFPKNVTVELKIDTGMSRNGIEPNQIPQALQIIEKNNLNLNGVFTHFCCADENNDHTQKQEQLFQQSIEQIRALTSVNFRTHCANSAGAHRVNPDLYDMARLGIGLYGYIDLPQYSKNLKPVLSLFANKISTRILNKGQTIGYGATYTVPKDNMHISNYDIGYGNGFLRLNERKKSTIADGRQILGRVSMDSFSVEGDDETICVFNDATIIAATHDSIHYEVLTHLLGNIERHII